MRIILTALLIGLVLVIIAGCGATPTATPSPTPLAFAKQPIREGPTINVRISGLPKDVNATVNVHSNQVTQWAYRGNGDSEITLPVSREDLVITAEAQGYVSHPISYTIHLDGMTAYVVESGQVTANEAKHLDFDFVK